MTEQHDPVEHADAVGDSSQNTESAETIRLDQFLKLAQVVQSGGEAKYLIQSGGVTVNGETETRRGKKLRHGDRVSVANEEFVIETD